MQVDQKENSNAVRDDAGNELSHAQSIFYTSKKLQNDVHALGLKVKRHEDSTRVLKSEGNKLDDSILDLQVTLGKYHSSSTPMVENDDQSTNQSEEETIEQILRHENTAAGILCHLKMQGATSSSYLKLTPDVLGIVATLGKVQDDNLSRLLSEYIGLEFMLAIVCKTQEGVRALETYDQEGRINEGSGIYSISASIGRTLPGRYVVLCLEYLRTYWGDIVVNDPQKRLDLPKPKLPSGECPPGFIGFAVNMIDLDSNHLSFLIPCGHGLRETLFYTLLNQTQVYATREQMIAALPCAPNGAISLDGGMTKGIGFFSLGNRLDVDVRFPKSNQEIHPADKYIEAEKVLQETKWKKQKMMEDLKREQDLFQGAKRDLENKKEEFVKFLNKSSSNVTQDQVRTAQNIFTPSGDA